MLNKNKIIYIGPFDFPIGDAAAARVLNNGKLFRSLGYQVHFIGMGKQNRENEKDVNGNYYYQDFHYYQSNELQRKYLNPILRTYDYLRRGKKALNYLKENISADIKLIIAYNPSTLLCLQLMKICKQHKIHFAVDLTEWYSAKELPGTYVGLPYLDSEYRMRFLYPKIENKIVISEFLYDYYSKDKNNTLLLPPLVDPEDNKWISENKIKDNNKGVLTFIYAGNPRMKDQIEIIIKVVLKLLDNKYNLRLFIVGIDSNYIQNIKLYPINIKKIKDNIIFTGKIPQDKVPAYYAISDFSLIIREKNRKNNAGFPTKLSESLISGTPVISTKTSDIEKYIINGKNGYLIEDSSETTLYNLILELMNLTAKEKENMKYNAKALGFERFTYSSYRNSAKSFIQHFNISKNENRN